MTPSNANPYASPGDTFAPFAIDVGELERADFIRRTYIHLAGAVIAFAALEACLLVLLPEAFLARTVGTMLTGFNWLICLGAFIGVSWIADKWARSATSLPKQYLGLTLYVVGEAIIFLPLLYIASRFGGPEVLPAAGIITLVVFGGLTATVMLTGADFSGIGPYLGVAGLAAMGLIVCSIFLGFNLGILFSGAMILLAAGYILYDTSNIMHHYRTDQHVAASLALFAAVALMFWYVVQLLMSLNRR